MATSGAGIRRRDDVVGVGETRRKFVRFGSARACIRISVFYEQQGFVTTRRSLLTRQSNCESLVRYVVEWNSGYACGCHRPENGARGERSRRVRIPRPFLVLGNKIQARTAVQKKWSSHCVRRANRADILMRNRE